MHLPVKPICQNTMLALYISVNYGCVTFVHFIHTVPYQHFYSSDYIILSCLCHMSFSRWLPSSRPQQTSVREQQTTKNFSTHCGTVCWLDIMAFLAKILVQKLGVCLQDITASAATTVAPKQHDVAAILTEIWVSKPGVS